jgi:hypothetical protein
MPSLNKHSRKAVEPVAVTLGDLILSMDGIDVDALLTDWRWLVDEGYEPVLLTALGDLFLEAPDGSVHWLHTGSGDLDRVTGSRDEFEQLMTRPEQVEEWFFPELVGTLKAQGIELARGQCYGYMNPPCLGGRNEPLNLTPVDVYVHFNILGQVASQVCEKPESAEAEPAD